jgi:Nucleotidyl transferase AbiEii toxin, Type IV TA system
LDLLGFGKPEPEAMLDVFCDVCRVVVENGVIFDSDALTIEHIREEVEYGGLRLKTNATLDSARVRVLIDIGFGDAVESQERHLPVQRHHQKRSASMWASRVRRLWFGLSLHLRRTSRGAYSQGVMEAQPPVLPSASVEERIFWSVDPRFRSRFSRSVCKGKQA